MEKDVIHEMENAQGDALVIVSLLPVKFTLVL